MTPPHVDIRSLRTVAGMTLDEVCGAMNEIDPSLTITRGALSAIENGLRGASRQTLAALAAAYGLDPASITTVYLPRQRQEHAA